MMSNKLKGLLIADFTIENLTGLFNNDSESPEVECHTAPYDQVMPLLLDQAHPCWSVGYDFVVVWTRPEAAVGLFNDVLSYRLPDLAPLLAQVDDFSAALSALSKRVRFVFVAGWCLPAQQRGLGMLDMRPGVGITNTLAQMNLRLAERMSSESNVFILDAQRWVATVGSRAFSPKLWYMGKIAFGNDVFVEAVRDIKSAISGLTGGARKLVIVDLDDTLWGGIVGDDGWENLKLGGHDFVGEAYIDFQRSLKALINRGVIIGIVSKNEEIVALEAIEKHPEMVLKQDDFAGWRINWNDKAQNIVELVAELNLGLQSVVFLDDNPVERNRVREALPEVLVPELPQDKMLYAATLRSLRCFDTPFLSTEDTNRAQMYASERKRQQLQQSVGSVSDWLRSLNIRVTVESLGKSNLERTVQLLNKTNQMNLTTRRLTEAELVHWEGQAGHYMWTFRVADKFGDSGLTGIISFEIDGKKGRIVDFVLSCRVMGRKVEEAMISRVYEFARSNGISEIFADFIQTKKNKPCFDFWMRSGFKHDNQSNRFSWDVSAKYPAPEEISIEVL